VKGAREDAGNAPRGLFLGPDEIGISNLAGVFVSCSEAVGCLVRGWSATSPDDETCFTKKSETQSFLRAAGTA